MSDDSPNKPKVTRFVCRTEDICNPEAGGPLPPGPNGPEPNADEAGPLKTMHYAYQELERIGWRNIIYCPKDGTMFLAIEAGSIGVHNCNYTGTWPNGSWWFYDGDMWPAHPILFKEVTS